MRPIRIAFATAAALAAFSLPATAQRSDNTSFFPSFGTGQSIAATTTSASVTLTGAALNDSELYILNAGTDTVFCRWGAGAQTAVNTDIAIPTGVGPQIFTKGAGTTVVACIAASTTATVRIITGRGNFN
jgi:hypothetical protein